MNSDSIVAAGGVTTFTSNPGAITSIDLVYNVTTPRTATTIYARLDGGEEWILESPLYSDTDTDAGDATWTVADYLSPGESFRLPVRIVAPASMAASQKIELHVWSVVAGSSGDETGVAKTEVPIVLIDAIAPENADSLSALASTPLSLQPGQSVLVNISYSVTTPRQGTQLRATLEDEAGMAPSGWTIAAEGIDIAAIDNSTALQPGDSFSASFTVVAPTDVELPQDVSLRIWSEAKTVTGIQPGLDDHEALSLSVAASPAEPALTCTSDDITTVTCSLDPGRADAIDGTLTLSTAAGWAYAINGMALPADGWVTLSDLKLDPALAHELRIEAAYQGSCADPDADHSAALDIQYTYRHVDSANATATLQIQASTSAPRVDITSVSFQDMPILETYQSLGTLTIDLDDLPSTCGWELEVTYADFESEMATVPASFLSLVQVSGIEGVTATMSDGMISISGPSALEQPTGTLTITTMMTFPVELPPGGYQTAVTVKAERLQ